MVYSALGRHPLSIIVKSRIINYWMKLCSDNLIKILRFLYSKHTCNDVVEFNWFRNVKTILEHCGLNYLWNDGVVFVKFFVKNHIRSISTNMGNELQ
jgi:hypothetical protein